MARHELGPAALQVALTVARSLPAGPVVVGCSGGADSMALALAAAWAARRQGTSCLAVIVDHGLQSGSASVAEAVQARLLGCGVAAEIEAVSVVVGDKGTEAAAREARLAALQRRGLPVLLGHTMDDQAESVLLGLLRGSGTRSLAGMAERRGVFLRPLLGLRRAQTEAACRDWAVEVWSDPMNGDRRFARVQARQAMAVLQESFARDLVPALARTAELSRADADLLDQQSREAVRTDGLTLAVTDLLPLPAAIRLRVLRQWLLRNGFDAEFAEVLRVDELLTNWRGQSGLVFRGGEVRREGKSLLLRPNGGRDDAGPNEPR